MNNKFKKLSENDCLFFDIEVVRNQKEIDTESKEFELYQQKIRDRQTDELPSQQETIDHYNQFAGLKLTYNKVVCASVGAIKEGNVYLKSYTGEEQEVLYNLYKKMQEYQYIVAYNGIAYDLPVCRVAAMKYPDVLDELPEKFNDSGKRPWNLDNVVDLMDYFKGTHFANSTLDEVCFHLGLDSPKDDIGGAAVSEVYYQEGVEKISEYCKKDVFATLNLFRKMQSNEPFHFENAVDIDKIKSDEMDVKELPILQKVLNAKKITKKDKEELEAKAKGLNDKEKKIALDLLKAVFGEKPKSKIRQEVVEIFS